MTKPKENRPGKAWRRGSLAPNEHWTDGATAFLVLKSLGKRYFTAIDTADLARVLTRRWCLRWQKGRAYVVSPDPRQRGIARRHTYLHRFLMEPGAGLEVDHTDGDRMNNRRCNLRVVTPAENHQNVDRGRGRLRNVYFDSRYPDRGWFTQSRIGGGWWAGYFATQDEAVAEAARLRRLHAPFANEARHTG